MSELTDDERIAILAELQWQYELFGKYKTLDEIAENFSVSPQEMRLALVELIPPMKARGLPVPEFLEAYAPSRFVADPTKPDPTFMMVAQSVLDLNNTKSLGAKLKEFGPLGITTKTWTNWMEQPVNREYFETLLNRRFTKDVEDQARLALARNVASGDLPSIKFYEEITGRYRPQDRNTQSLTLIIQMLMEVLARHVGPEIIGKVADELDNLPIIIDAELSSPVPALNSDTND